ncbi:uncharacterized protein LOC144713133 [Wolffia australiana]
MSQEQSSTSTTSEEREEVADSNAKAEESWQGGEEHSSSSYGDSNEDYNDVEEEDESSGIQNFWTISHGTETLGLDLNKAPPPDPPPFMATTPVRGEEPYDASPTVGMKRPRPWTEDAFSEDEQSMSASSDGVDSATSLAVDWNTSPIVFENSGTPNWQWMAQVFDLNHMPSTDDGGGGDGGSGAGLVCLPLTQKSDPVIDFKLWGGQSQPLPGPVDSGTYVVDFYQAPAPGSFPVEYFSKVGFPELVESSSGQRPLSAPPSFGPCIIGPGGGRSTVIHMPLPVSQSTVVHSPIPVSQSTAIHSPLPVSQSAAIHSPLPVSQSTAIHSPLPVSQSTAIHSPLPVSQSTAIHSPLPVSQSTAIHSPLPVSQSTAIHSPLPVSQSTAIHSPLPVSQSTAIHSPLPFSQSTVIHSPLPVSQSTVIYRPIPVNGRARVSKNYD